MEKPSYKTQLPKITTFMFDVDGVLTNGDVLLYNDQVLRTLNTRDSYAIQYAKKMGFGIYIITGGDSKDMHDRLLGLGVDEVHLRSSVKLHVYNDIKNRKKLEDAEILYMGDDIPDLPLLNRCGVSTCPSDAAFDVLSRVDYQSPYPGGKHCVRDVIEQVLRVQGKWMTEEAYGW